MTTFCVPLMKLFRACVDSGNQALFLLRQVKEHWHRNHGGWGAGAPLKFVKKGLSPRNELASIFS